MPSVVGLPEPDRRRCRSSHRPYWTSDRACPCAYRLHHVLVAGPWRAASLFRSPDSVFNSDPPNPPGEPVRSIRNTTSRDPEQRRDHQQQAADRRRSTTWPELVGVGVGVGAGVGVGGTARSRSDGPQSLGRTSAATAWGRTTRSARVEPELGSSATFCTRLATNSQLLAGRTGTCTAGPRCSTFVHTGPPHRDRASPRPPSCRAVSTMAASDSGVGVLDMKLSPVRRRSGDESNIW